MSLSPPGSLTLSQLCTHSPLQSVRPHPAAPSPPYPPHTALGVQAPQWRLTRPELDTPNYTELYTVCTPHYTQPRGVPPAVAVTGRQVLSSTCMHRLLHTHTRPPPLLTHASTLPRVSHTCGLTQAHPRTPHPAELHPGGTRTHTRAHTFCNNIRHAISFS